MKTRVLHTFALWSAAIAVSGTMFLQSGIVRAGEWEDVEWPANGILSNYDDFQRMDEQRRDLGKAIAAANEEDQETLPSDVDAMTAMLDKVASNDLVTEIDDDGDCGSLSPEWQTSF
jgi:hypothetical protein